MSNEDEQAEERGLVESVTLDDCPQCGVATEKFTEGYCVGCYLDRQRALDLHNVEYDWWQRLSPSERDSEIKKRMK